jgi:hypothetical protein
MSGEYMDESYQEADNVIEMMKTHLDKDYTAGREEIARVFDEDIWNGNWESVTDFGIEGLEDLRFIQEDEYDQHMDDDPDKPTWEDMILSGSGYYVWYA